MEPELSGNFTNLYSVWGDGFYVVDLCICYVSSTILACRQAGPARAVGEGGDRWWPRHGGWRAPTIGELSDLYAKIKALGGCSGNNCTGNQSPFTNVEPVYWSAGRAEHRYDRSGREGSCVSR